LHLSQRDFEAVLHSHWNHTSGRADASTLILTCALALAFSGSLIYQLNQRSRVGYDGHTILFAILTRATLTSTLQSAKAFLLRTRLAHETWDNAYCTVPTPLALFLTNNGLRFAGRGYDQTFPWVHIKRMWLTRRKTIWAAVTTSGMLMWMPADAFETREGFEDFADQMYDVWKAKRPSGKAFEVIFPSAESQ
jgi:hypothetical protein